MPKLETQAQLEEMLNDPVKLEDYVTGKIHEEVGDFTKEGVKMALEAAGFTKGGARRLPMSDEAADQVRGTSAEELKALGSWGHSQKYAAKGRRDAQSLDGKFKSFGEFLELITPKAIQAGIDERVGLSKVLGEGQGDQGGFLVPDQFRTELMMLSVEQAVVRPRAMILPMSTTSLRIPTIRDTTHASTVFGGVRAYWVPESGSLTSSEPTFGSAVLTAKKLTGLTQVSNELLADSAVGVEALLTRLFGQALPYFEDDAFINGIGGAQPVGLINADALVTVAKETGQQATTIVYNNILKMFSRMLPSSVGRAVWLAHPDTLPALATMSLDVGTGGSAVFLPAGGASGAPFATLLGRPIIFTEKCQTLGTAGDLFFVDVSFYLIGDRQTMEMATDPFSRFTNDETRYRFIERLDGRPWIDSALTPRNGTNTLSPFVNLATRS